MRLHVGPVLLLAVAVALGAYSGRVNEPSSKADNAAATFATLASAATAEAVTRR